MYYCLFLKTTFGLHKHHGDSSHEKTNNNLVQYQQLARRMVDPEIGGCLVMAALFVTRNLLSLLVGRSVAMQAIICRMSEFRGTDCSSCCNTTKH